MNILETAKSKYSVVRIERGYVNSAREEYDEEAREYGGEVTSVLVTTAKTEEVKDLLRQSFPQARLWEGMWQGHIVTPDITPEEAEKVVTAREWPQYRFVFGPRPVRFWHTDHYQRIFEGETLISEWPRMWVDVIDPRVQGSDDSAFAFTSIFADGSEVGHSAHVMRHKFLGAHDSFGYFCAVDGHELVPPCAEIVAEGGQAWNAPSPEMAKRRHLYYPVFRMQIPESL